MKTCAVSPGGRRCSFLLLFVVALASTLAWPGAASAAKKRVGIPRFDGQQEALIRKVVMQIVKGKGFDLVRSREIDDAVKSLSISLDSNDAFQGLAKEMALSAVVTGEVGKKKAKLTVRNGSDGSVAGEATFAGANPKKLAVDVAKSFWRKLGSAIERGKPPAGAKKPGKEVAAAAPEDNEEDSEAKAAAEEKDDDKDKDKDKDKADEKPSKSEEKAEAPAEEEKPKKKRKKVVASEDEESTSEGGGNGMRYLDLSAGVRAFSRSLTYNQDRDSKLRNYALTAPSLGIGAIWYPGGMSGSGGALANIGLDASAELAFGLKSKTKTNVSYPTSVHDYAIGLRFRIPLGAGEVGVSGTGGEHAFKLSSGPNADRTLLNDLPDTIYRYLRLGLFVRAPIGKVSVFGGAAYRYVLSPGQIKTAYFPGLSVGGVDANAGLGYQLSSAIELRAGVDLRRYFYNFHSTANSMYVVGGAIDQYITGTFMVAITLDGPGKKD
ncbi:MAG TPA: hypothetical protein VNO55_07645 [Polyangia bacterium]|nr:hypothetical protein [Polyangia bacterium]